MPKNQSTPTISSIYERLTATMDALLEGKISPEHGNAIANTAEKIAQFAKLELQAIDIALSNDREITHSGFLPEIEQQSGPGRLSRQKLLDR